MITVRDLTKFYGGKRALGPVSFDIQDGETVGFLGLNGAGKTTALRILACDLRPSAGSVRVGDVDAIADPHAVRRDVGFLPESPPLYQDMQVGDYLAFTGRLRGMTAAQVKQRVPAAEELTHLREVHGELIRNLSHGFRQRVGVAQAIVHEPKLLILDEPTRGLDPVQIVEMRGMIRDLKHAHTVLISSHILPEISETCDRLLVLGEGAIVGAGTEDELSSRVTTARRVVVVVRAPREEARAALRAIANVTAVSEGREADGGVELELSATTDVRAAACRALVEKGWDVVRLDRAEHELETVFLRLVSPAGPPPDAAAKDEEVAHASA